MQRAARLTDLHMTDQTAARSTIEWFLKAIFTAAAFACGQETFYPESVQVIRDLFPELDLRHLDSLIAFNRAEAPTSAEACESLQQAVVITEELNYLLERRLRSSDQWKRLSSVWDGTYTHLIRSQDTV